MQAGHARVVGVERDEIACMRRKKVDGAGRSDGQQDAPEIPGKGRGSGGFPVVWEVVMVRDIGSEAATAGELVSLSGEGEAG